jgi:hypothetical protein
MTDFPLPASHLRQEYEAQKTLFESQPVIVQRFLEGQARLIADGMVSKLFQIQFSLPDRVLINVKQIGQPATVTLPNEQREQKIGSLWTTMTRRELRQAIIHHMQELEQSPDHAIATSASLLRYCTASHMVSNMLPDGRSVTYLPEADEVIPSIPSGDDAPESAITQANDAIAEQDADQDPEQAADGTRRGALQSPFVPAARKFFLPQWVAFDERGALLTGSEKEAEAHIQSMQRYVQILHRASSLAAYMVASSEYQRKRYGILGQLINQGRALANFQTTTIIHEIQARAKKGSLNRGLSISLPYFDDQNLVMAETRFEVIPAGRIRFIPSFVTYAARSEQAQVSQDTRLNASTRKHLLSQLKALESTFQS